MTLGEFSQHRTPKNNCFKKLRELPILLFLYLVFSSEDTGLSSTTESGGGGYANRIMILKTNPQSEDAKSIVKFWFPFNRTVCVVVHLTGCISHTLAMITTPLHSLWMLLLRVFSSSS